MKRGVMEVDSVNALMAQLSAMSKKLEKLEASAVGTQVACGLCSGPHENHNCSLLQDDQSSAAQVNYMGNQPIQGLHTMIPIPTHTILVEGITSILVGEVIKDNKGNGTTILKDHHSLQLNLLHNPITLKLP
ncbi:hypothetical protein PIB30_067431 [Stylosanthes scabra]|uniref:Uncharacterized protein n=1 Tax=Stylosanthes scabra TaxID=79078 RepID=A0ABU6SMR1_9FABA|nr:hypothetical protein [Stylosanthes scabra]